MQATYARVTAVGALNPANKIQCDVAPWAPRRSARRPKGHSLKVPLRRGPSGRGPGRHRNKYYWTVGIFSICPALWGGKTPRGSQELT